MSKPQRFIALTAALVFLATSIGFSIMVVLQMRDNDDNQTDQSQQITDALNQQNANENKLAGTKLQGFTPVDKIDTLEKIDIVEGDGEVVKEGAKVTAHYTGALAKDGTIFQSSYDTGQPIPFGLNEVIPGWTQGVPGMKVGGKRRLLIPSQLAYGDQGTPDGSIPAQSDLVFDVELIKIGQ